MIHIDSAPNAKPEIKQVEFNTIASSFGGLSAQVSALHKCVEISLHVDILLIILATFIATLLTHRQLLGRFPSLKILVSPLLL